MTAITAGAPSSNFFLDGNFSPVHEERDIEDMEVSRHHTDRPAGPLSSCGSEPRACVQ